VDDGGIGRGDGRDEEHERKQQAGGRADDPVHLG
jgi:hypothetical protein